MKKSTTEIVVVLTIITTLLFISGQQGCQLPGVGKVEAAKRGIDFDLISGVDYLAAGKTLALGESFYVGVKIENYDKEARTGQICIHDNIAESFGGVHEECKAFNVKAAEIMEKEKVVPGITEVYFPEVGEYSYYGLPEMLKPYPAELQVSLKYVETTLATGSVTVPGEEQPSISQEPAPIAIGVTKNIRKMQDAYKVDLAIMLKKQQEAKIFTPDFSQENIAYFSARLEPQSMECKTQDGKPVTNLIEFKNERLIKCSSIVYLATKEESYPLVITLNYGVSIEKHYPFSIKTTAKER